ncbi:uncharacterized protein LOC143252405 isoform X3 [Tachypleus tridentatus]
MLKTVSSFQKLYTVTTCDKSTKQKIVCRYLKKQYKVTTRDESNKCQLSKSTQKSPCVHLANLSILFAGCTHCVE